MCNLAVRGLRRNRLATVAVLLLAGCVPGLALAQSPVHAPGKAPTHADDFSGIWAIEDGMINRTIDKVRGAPPPPFRPDWMAAWLATQAKANRGERAMDAAKECWPTGMPGVNNWVYPGEILMTPGQVTMLAEYENQVRRIFTDGRGHPAPDELEPTLRGHSIGHWEGKTLVIDTVGVRTETQLGLRGRHSSQMHVVERLRLLGPDKLEWFTSVEDPVALTQPWVSTKIMVRQPPETEIREYICEENQTREPYLPSTGDIVWPDPEGPAPPRGK